MKRALSWCAWIVGALVVGYLLRTYVVGTARVVGSSMEPTLNSSDIVVVTKFDYWFSGPERGDVTLCRLPEHSESETYLKRVAAVPGDAFGGLGNGFFRCSYAASVENIQTALERIARSVGGQ